MLGEWKKENPHYGGWPTLQWLKDHGHRVIFFIEDKSDTKDVLTSEDKPSFFIPVWKFMVETQYGKFNPELACVERMGSMQFAHGHRPLYLLNYFATLRGALAPIERLHNWWKNVPEIILAEEKANSYDQLKVVIETCKEKNIAHGRLPNFIALDFVNLGNPIKMVNEINRKHERELGLNL